MERISELLQEAKPLYFQRKRRRTQAKAALFSLAAIFVAFFSVMQFEGGNFVALSDKHGEASVIYEEYGLPVDDYGLLMVN